MEKISTILNDCYILEPKRFGDDRGYYEAFYIKKGCEYLMNGIVQGARSKSSLGTIRGLHIQRTPLSQSKLVECLKGGVIDIVVDIRKDSSTYKKYIAVELTEENGRQLFVPRGFLHGFVAIKENTLFQYLVDSNYSTIHEQGVSLFDPEISIDIDGIFSKYNIEKPLFSDKDKILTNMSTMDLNYYKEYSYLVTGCNGQLGHDVIKELNSRGIYNILELDKDDMDITSQEEVLKIITEYKPKHIIHCAAYTAVDKAENDELKAINVNVMGTKNIVNAARLIDATLTYISTDYVFDGTKEGLYEVEDNTSPISVYGKTKLEGEKLVQDYEFGTVVRTSWVFGINGNNFIKTMLRLAETKDSLNIVNDQFGSPTYTKDLAKLLIDMKELNKFGTYHANNEGYCSWTEFAKYIFEEAGKEVIVNGIPTSEYKTDAKRPLNSRLSKKSLDDAGLNRLPDWHVAVSDYLKELNIENKKAIQLKK